MLPCKQGRLRATHVLTYTWAGGGLWLRSPILRCRAVSNEEEEAREAERRADGVRAEYQLLANRVAGLTPESAPALYAYLQSDSPGDGAPAG